MKITYVTLFCYFVHRVSGFWDYGTTTTAAVTWRWDEWTARTSRFRWQRTESVYFKMLYPWWDWYELEFRKRLHIVAGISYGMINISTGAILNRRTLVTSANCLDPYMNDAMGVRVWALGRKGAFNTPFRYRVWRITRLVQRSTNPEHQHGPFAYHSPRDDVTIVHTLDQIYLYSSLSRTYAYAYRAFLLSSNRLTNLIYFVGCGFEYLTHVRENYKIFYHYTTRADLRDCSKLIPKWWGKFICFDNTIKFPCVQNGGPLFEYEYVAGVGCFEIRANEESYLVFTDLRYYMKHIYNYAHIKPGEYYEYAYPQWAVRTSWILDGAQNDPMIPIWNMRDDIYPLGKK